MKTLVLFALAALLTKIQGIAARHFCKSIYSTNVSCIYFLKQ